MHAWQGTASLYPVLRAVNRKLPASACWSLPAAACRVPPQLMVDGLNMNEVLNRSEATTPLPEDPADANDPLLRTNIRALLRQGLGSLAAADPAFMAAAAAHLGPDRELQALQQLLESDGETAAAVRRGSS